MSYIPCKFDRSHYLSMSDRFESMSIDDVEYELSEFNNDAEDLAYELAYTRYALSKLEHKDNII